MSGFDFERESFVRAETKEPQHREPLSVGKPLIVLLLAGAALFAIYKLTKLSGLAEPAQNGSQAPQIEQRIEALEHRLDQIEKRRNGSVVPPKSAAGKEEPRKVNGAPPLAVAPASYLIAAEPKPQPIASPVPASLDHSAIKPEETGPARPEASAAQEGWEATADRLGNVVGELTAHRDQIERTRETLDQLSERLGRESEPFTLRKGSARQRVGPVWAALPSTDPSHQRYTLRLFLDDKWVELRDRALHEAVQFYTSEGDVSLELVVSDIRKNGVTGRMTLPKQP